MVVEKRVEWDKVDIGNPSDSMTPIFDGEGFVRQEAKCSRHFGELSVMVYAPRRYFKMEIKRDWYSYGIVKSKSEDWSESFYDDFKKAFDKITPSTFDLITIIPKTKAGEYSPTLVSIGKKLSAETHIPFAHVLNRSRSTEKKMTDPGNVDARNKSNQGTISITNPEFIKEKNILIIDDVKTTGDTMLTCAQLLKKNGAKNVVGLCLGINSIE